MPRSARASRRRSMPSRPSSSASRWALMLRRGAILQVRGREMMADVQRRKHRAQFRRAQGARRRLDRFPGWRVSSPCSGRQGSGKTTLLQADRRFRFSRLRQRSASMAKGSSACRSKSAASAWCSRTTRCFPNMSVADNVAFGLSRARRRRGPRSPARCSEALDLVQLGKLGERRPHQLSGGQQQRVALARAHRHQAARAAARRAARRARQGVCVSTCRSS